MFDKIVAGWIKRPFHLLFLLLMLILAACGGSEQASISEEAPPRRGGADVLGQVQEITADILDVSEDDVTESAEFRADLGADDEDMDELVDEFEEAFGIELSDAEEDELTTVQTAVDLIESKQ